MTDNKKKKTVGQHSKDLNKPGKEENDPVEVQREVHKEYESHIFESVDRGKKEFNDDFFIVVLVLREGYMRNVIRNKFFPRKSCPTPDYDQTVYHYRKRGERFDFLWCIPSKETCELLHFNMLNVDPKERELLQFVLSFYDGTLMKECKKLNGETID